MATFRHLSSLSVLLLAARMCIVSGDACINEVDSIPVPSVRSLAFTEGDVAFLNISMACQATSTLVVTFTAASPQGRLATMPRVLIFSPSSWDAPQTVAVFVDDDAVVQTVGSQADNFPYVNGTVTANVSVLGTPGSSYTSTNSSVSVAVYDDDIAATYMVSSDPMIAFEGGASAFPNFINATEGSQAGDAAFTPAFLVGTASMSQAGVGVALFAAPSNSSLSSSVSWSSPDVVSTASGAAVWASLNSQSASWLTPRLVTITTTVDNVQLVPTRGVFIEHQYFSVYPSNLTQDPAWQALTTYDSHALARAYTDARSIRANATSGWSSSALHARYIYDHETQVLPLTTVSAGTVWEGDFVTLQARLASWPLLPAPYVSEAQTLAVSVSTSSCFTQLGSDSLVFDARNFSLFGGVVLQATNDGVASGAAAVCNITVSSAVLPFSRVAQTVPVVVLDDDSPGGANLVLSPSTAETSVVEGATGRFSVSLDRPPTTGTITVVVDATQINTTLTPRALPAYGASATNGVLEPLGYTATGPTGASLPTSLVFGAGNYSTPQLITIVTQNDVTVQISSARTVAVSFAVIGKPSDPQFYRASAQQFLVVGDDDVAAATLSTLSLVVWSGKVSTYNLTLAAQPIAPVNVSFVPTDTTEYILGFTPALCVFQPAAWNVPCQLQVTATAVNASGTPLITSLQVLHVLQSTDSLFNDSQLYLPTRHTLQMTVISNVTANGTAGVPDLDTSPAPALVSATLSESAHEAVLVFDKPTALGPVIAGTGVLHGVPCVTSELFTAATLWTLDGGVGAGSGSPSSANFSLCYWSNASALVVRYNSSNTRWLANGDVLSLAPGAIRATQYSVNFASGSLPLSGRLSIPLPVSAAFLSSGTALAVTFSSPTARTLGSRIGMPVVAYPATAACEAVVNTSSLGAGAACTWSSETTLLVRFGLSANVLPARPYPTQPVSTVSAAPCDVATAILLAAGVARATPSSVLSNPEALCVQVNDPTSYPTPQPVITGSLTVGTCTDIALDAALTPSVGGRPNSYQWTVAGANTLAAPTLTGINAYLATSGAGSRIQLSVPSTHTLPGAQYTVTLSVTNFLYVNESITPSAVASATVTVAAGDVPTLAIDGPSSVAVLASQPTLMRARAQLSTCANDNTTSGRRLVYNWSVHTDVDAGVQAAGANITVLTTAGIQQYVTTTDALIRFPSGVLRIGATYTLSVLVSVVDAKTGLDLQSSNNASVVIRVKPQGLIAAIGGGGRQAGVDQSLQLDASRSTDADDFPSVPFAFRWSCFMLPNANVDTQNSAPSNAMLTAAQLQALGSPCMTLGGVDLNTLPALSTAASSGVLTLPPLLLNSGVYTFVANVSKGSAGGNIPDHYRWATALTVVTMLPGAPPVVYALARIAAPGSSAKLRTDDVSVTAQSSILLFGRANSSLYNEAVTRWVYSWSTPEYTATGARSILPALTSSTTLAVNASRLPVLTRVSFTFQATLVSGATGTPISGATAKAYISLTRAGPPFGGSVNAVPNTGIAALTRFSLSAGGWLPGSALRSADPSGGDDGDVGSGGLEYMFSYMLGNASAMSVFRDPLTGSVTDISQSQVESGAVTLQPLSSAFSSQPRLDNVLCPQGTFASNNSLTLVLTVRDASSGTQAVSFMSAAGKPMVITVASPAASLAGVLNFVSGAVGGVLGNTGTTNASLLSHALTVGDRDDVLATTTALASLVRTSSLAALAARLPCLNAGLDCGDHGECIGPLAPSRPTAACSCNGGYSGSACKVAPVPVPGAYSAWSEWSQCTLSCGSGNQSRTRTCMPSQYGGTLSPCELYSAAQAVQDYSVPAPVLVEQVACNSGACPPTPVHGGYGAWSAYTPCNATCGVSAGYFLGVMTRTRECNSPTPTGNGLTCEAQPELGSAVQTQACNTRFCPGYAKRCPGSSAQLAAAPNPYGIPVVECSGHGACVRAPVACSASAPGCLATCECSEPYIGSSCALTRSEQGAAQNATDTLLGVVTTLASNSDSSAHGVSQAMSALTAVITSADDVSGSGAPATLNALLSLLLTSEGAPRSGVDLQRRLLAANPTHGLRSSSGSSSSSPITTKVPSHDRAVGVNTHSRVSMPGPRALQTAGEAVDASQPFAISRSTASNMLTLLSIVNNAIRNPSADNATTLSVDLDDIARRAVLGAARDAAPGSEPVDIGNADGDLQVRLVRTGSSEANAPSSSVSVSSSDGTSLSFPSSLKSSTTQAVTLPNAGSFDEFVASTSQLSLSTLDFVVSDWTGIPPVSGELEGVVAARHARRLVAGAPNENSTATAGNTGLRVDAVAPAGGVRNIEVFTAGSISPVSVSNLSVPILFEIALSRDVNPSPADVSCTYFDKATGSWSDSGLIAVGYRVDAVTGQLILQCASLHLSSFSSFVSPYTPSFNAIDPVGDAGLLTRYLDPSNLFPIVVLGVIGAAFVLAWAVSMVLDRRTLTTRDALREAHLLRYGRVERGPGKDRLRMLEDLQADAKGSGRTLAELETRMAATDDEVAAVEKRGTMFLAVKFLWTHWLDGVRRSHSWGSVFLPPLDEQLVISRPQRVLVLLSAVLAGMAANAVFFGYDPSNIAAQVVFGILSIIIMLPIEELFPRLFETANSFDSRTLEQRKERKVGVVRKRRQSAAAIRRASNTSGRVRRWSLALTAETPGSPGGMRLLSGHSRRMSSSGVATPVQGPTNGSEGNGTPGVHRQGSDKEAIGSAKRASVGGRGILLSANRARRGSAVAPMSSPADCPLVLTSPEEPSRRLGTYADGSSVTQTVGASEPGAYYHNTTTCEPRDDDIVIGEAPSDDDQPGQTNNSIEGDLTQAVSIARRHRRSSAAARAYGDASTAVTTEPFAAAHSSFSGPRSPNKSARRRTSTAWTQESAQGTPHAATSIGGISCHTPCDMSPVTAIVDSSTDANRVVTGAGIALRSRRASTTDEAASLLTPFAPTGTRTAPCMLPLAVDSNDAMARNPLEKCGSPEATTGSRAPATNLYSPSNHFGVPQASLQSPNSGHFGMVPRARRHSAILRSPSPAASLPRDQAHSTAVVRELDRPELITAFSNYSMSALGKAEARQGSVGVAGLAFLQPDPEFIAARERDTQEEMAAISEPRDPDDVIRNRVWVAMGILGVIQSFAGIASVLAAIFIVASEQGNMSVRSGASLAVVVISGMLMIGFGAIAHNASRRHQIGTSIAAMFMALSVEALGGFLLWWFDLPFRTTIYIGVAAAQLLPVVFAILAGITIECVKSRIASRLAEVNTSKTVAVVLHPTPQETAAAIKVQGIVRGLLARNRTLRYKELRTWQDVKAERGLMVSLVYCGVGVVCAMLLYLCLLYGVKFDARQTQSWILATVTGMVTDIFIQQPGVELLKTFIALIVMLCRQSVKSGVIHSLAAKRDALRISIRVAREREESLAQLTAGGEKSGAPVEAGTGPVDASTNGGVTHTKSQAARGAEMISHRVGIADVLADWSGRRN